MSATRNLSLASLRGWWLSTDVSQTSLTSLGVVTSGLVVEAVGYLIWRDPVHRLALAAIGMQQVSILLGAPVAMARLSPSDEGAQGRGRRRLALANHLRRLANHWRLLVGAGAALAFASLPLFVVLVELGPPTAALKGVGWVFASGLFVACWGWFAAIAPRRLRVPLPQSVDVLTPLRVIDNPRDEARLALTATVCLIGSTLLQFAALYSG